MFEAKPIKRGSKILVQKLKTFTQILKTNIFSTFQQLQQLHHCSYFPKPIYFQKTKQHGPGSSHEERKRRLDKVISQDIERVGDNDRHTENGEGYQEDGRKSKHNNNGGGRIHFNSKYKQQNNKCDEHCSNIRESSILGLKQYG